MINENVPDTIDIFLIRVIITVPNNNICNCD